AYFNTYMHIINLVPPKKTDGSVSCFSSLNLEQSSLKKKEKKKKKKKKSAGEAITYFIIKGI
nr:hypothetical protein [Candidatus Liberibacter asiaticus]